MAELNTIEITPATSNKLAIDKAWDHLAIIN